MLYLFARSELRHRRRRAGRVSALALVAGALGLLLLLAYLPALRVPFLSDDLVLLTEAQLRYDRTIPLPLFAIDPHWGFHRPLAKLLWLAQYALWGRQAPGYHALSLALHWVNSLLVAALAWQLVRPQRLLALLAGLIFALLPLQVEVVVWLASQYDLLATLFYLATLICILRAWRQRSLAWYLLGLLAYQLCLWSKESAFTLPGALLLLDCVLVPRPPLRVLIIGLLPFGLLLGANLLQRYLAWGSIGGYALLATVGFSWPALGMTVFKLLAPLNEQLFPHWLVLGGAVLSLVLLLAAFFAPAQRRALGFAWGWLALTFAPILQILPVGSDLQNSRLLYLPSVGLAIALALGTFGLHALLLRLRVHIEARTNYAGLAVVACAGAVLVHAHTQPWVMAGREVVHTLEELHRLIPTFAPGTMVQTAGLPDTYKGAYIYRLGLNHAFGHRYAQTFQLEQLAALPPLAPPPQGQRYQVAFAQDVPNQRWEIVEARGVLTSSAIAPPPEQDWNLRRCDLGWDGFCRPGDGLVLGGAQPQSTLTPLLNMWPDRWIEVGVDVEAREPVAAGAGLELAWRYAAAGGWSQANADTIGLAPGKYSLRFFIRPRADQVALRQLRLRLRRQAAAVYISRITIRPIP